MIIDVNKGSLTFERKGKAYVISLQGLQTSVYTHLALLGAFNLLKSKSDPYRTWEFIRQGLFKSPPKNLPAIIKALSVVSGKSLDEARKLYQVLNKEERKALKSDPRIIGLVSVGSKLDLDELFSSKTQAVQDLQKHPRLPKVRKQTKRHKTRQLKKTDQAKSSA